MALGLRKGVHVALRVMRCIDLDTHLAKFKESYNKTLDNNENDRKSITNIEKLLKVWAMRQLSLEGKISFSKTLAISKIAQLALVNEVPSSTIYQLNKIKNEKVKTLRSNIVVFVMAMRTKD